MKGEVLATNPSKSNPNKLYEIIRGNDGVTYCSCWPWRMNRTCSHLESFLSGQKSYSVRKVKNTNGKIDTYLDLEEAIRKAVQELT